MIECGDAGDETRVNWVHVVLFRSNNWVIRVNGVFDNSINWCCPGLGFNCLSIFKCILYSIGGRL
jgi:hypothetical protein